MKNFNNHKKRPSLLKRAFVSAVYSPAAALAAGGEVLDVPQAPAEATAAAAAAPVPMVKTKADSRAKFKTSVGGQAVMEGVMMRGPERWALSVRTPDGSITTEEHETKKRPWGKWPILRGILSFFDSITMGYKTLMRSAELALSEEELQQEESKFDRWLEKHFGEKATKVVMGVAAVLGIALALGLFMFLPTTIVRLVDGVFPLYGFKSLVEGLIKIGLFIAYLALVSRMNDIKRVFRYHGAEHKSIACYESGDEMTVANVRTHTRFHPRCGTSFLLIVLILSILVYSVLPWSGTFVRVGLKLLMLPLVMGFAYELIRLAGRYTNPVTRVISAPGLWLQRLTTVEPDDSMIEVALAAVAPVLPPTPDKAKW